MVLVPGAAVGARWFDETQTPFGAMNGRTVILQAVRKLSEAALEITARNNLTLEQIDVVAPHQAKLNQLQALGQRLGLSMERLVVNVGRFGAGFTEGRGLVPGM